MKSVHKQIRSQVSAQVWDQDGFHVLDQIWDNLFMPIRNIVSPVRNMIVDTLDNQPDVWYSNNINNRST